MILLEQFINFKNEEFSEMFLVVVQLGAILAVVLLFWERIWPFQRKDKSAPMVKGKIMGMWGKIIVACLPAAVVGLLFDDIIDEVFYNPYVVDYIQRYFDIERTIGRFLWDLWMF